jgi:hypothetical protein
MKRFKSIFTLAFAMLFISAMSFTSCGGKKEANNETDTEQTEGGEHPTEGEHPAGGEHPTEGDSTEHPADSTEH